MQPEPQKPPCSPRIPRGGAKYPKTVASLRRDEAELLAFFDFLPEH